MIRLNFPPLTEERRKELVKGISKRGEECKVAIRNVRRDSLEGFKKQKKDGEITEDDLKNLETQVQKLTDKFVEKFFAREGETVEEAKERLNRK